MKMQNKKKRGWVTPKRVYAIALGVLPLSVGAFCNNCMCPQYFHCPKYVNDVVVVDYNCNNQNHEATGHVVTDNYQVIYSEQTEPFGDPCYAPLPDAWDLYYQCDYTVMYLNECTQTYEYYNTGNTTHYWKPHACSPCQ